ncbi:MAG: ATP-binding cassette domain-containing protein, partial [Rubrobacter sp.]
MQEIAQKPLALQMRGVGKSFPGVKALDDVDFELRAGEVMGLVGENGAGKSTLLKILAGVHQQDEGEISVAGQTVEISDPQDSQRLNVAMIYQELNLAEHLSVAENVFVGREPRTKFGFVDFRAMNRDTRRLFEESLHTTDIDPRVEVRRLSIAQKQLVEIARALSLKADIMVMDEPTSSLSDSEVRVLLEFVCRLRDSGLAVIYVSHRLEEVFEVGDRVTVL